jgi:hypothetical protein
MKDRIEQIAELLVNEGLSVEVLYGNITNTAYIQAGNSRTGEIVNVAVNWLAPKNERG